MVFTRLQPRRLAGSLLGRLGATPVWLSADLGRLPPLERDISPLEVARMDMEDESQIEAWLRIQQQAFPSWRLTRADYDDVIWKHQVLRVRSTYLLLDGGRAVGATSSAVLRGDDAIGSGHQAALLPEYRGRGLGRHMALYRYHRLREEGIRRCETETTLAHRRSIHLHFGIGFQPKPDLDPWNGPDRATRLERRLARHRLARMHALWLRGAR